MGEINTVMVDMPTKIKGCVHNNSDGSYTVFINAKLSSKIQQETYIHELNHIRRGDFDKRDVDRIEYNSFS